MNYQISHMRLPLILIGIIIRCTCYSQNISPKVDTLLVKQNVTLLLDNGFAIPSFSVSGDIYLTTNEFIFRPVPYRGKRYEMYNGLVKDIRIQYDSITSARRKSRLFGGLEVKTKAITYKIEMTSSIKHARSKNLHEIVSKINQLRDP